MHFDNLNLLAVAAAWLVNVMIGAFWYSPAGFAKQWAELTGIDMMKMPKSEANRSIGFVAISALVQAFTLAVVIRSLELTTASEALIAAFVLWLGLTAATTVGVTLYSRRSWKFWWINAAYFLIVMSINCLILTLWQ
jgi:hypothetical protein